MNQPIQPIDTPIMLFDGTSVSNSGAAAAVLLMPNGRRYTVSQFLSQIANDIEAEYTGLIIGLRKARQLGIKVLEVKGDSETIFNQVNGLSAVTAQNLQLLYQEVQKLMLSFKEISLEYIPEEQNRPAIAAVNRCIGEALGIESKPPTPTSTSVLPAVASLVKLGVRATDTDYRHLNSQIDEFTLKSLTQLRDLVPETVRDAIALRWDGDEQHLADIYRWYLRGLPPQMALRKVEIDYPKQEDEGEKLPWEGELLSSVLTEVRDIETSEPFFSSPSSEPTPIDGQDFSVFSFDEIAQRETLIDFPFAGHPIEKSSELTLAEPFDEPEADPSKDTFPNHARVQDIVEMLDALPVKEKQLLVEELIQLPDWVNLVLKAIADRMIGKKS